MSDLLIGLLLKGALVIGAALVAWGAWHALTARYVAQGVAQQQAKDAPIIAALTKQRDAAVAANSSLSASVGVLKQAVADAGAHISALVTAGDALRARAQAAMATAKLASDVASAQTAKLIAIANSPSVAGADPALECDAARQILADYATWRRGLH